MRILLGLTGSVATVLHVKLVQALQELGEVDAIITERARHFINFKELRDILKNKNGNLYSDLDEWDWKGNTKWDRDDPILHIELRNKSSVLVIAPCSANTMGKIANGFCDNLLTSVARAWDMNRPVIIAPAMNTNMWEHPVTKEHLSKFWNWGYKVVQPQSKMLACKTQGMGAMAEIKDIVEATKDSLRWLFPVSDVMGIPPRTKTCCSGIPVGNHPGAFGTKRKHSIHTGVDIYTEEGQSVMAVENGKIVAVEHFTGPQDGSPWWNDTDCVLIEGASGVVCYGEINPCTSINAKVGANIKKGTWIGNVKRVLKEGKERPDIDGHSTSMLHMELYPHGYYIPSDGWEKDVGILRDPTPFLLNAVDRPTRLLKGKE